MTDAVPNEPLAKRSRVNLNLLNVCYQMYAGVTLTKTELKVIEARSGKGRDILFFVVKKNITASKEWKTA